MGEAKIVAIGPRAETVGLRSIGIEVAPAESEQEAAEALRERTGEAETRLLILSETVAEGLRERVAAIRDGGTPVLVVPSHRGAKELSFEWMKSAMEHSIGVDVLSD